MSFEPDAEPTPTPEAAAVRALLAAVTPASDAFDPYASALSLRGALLDPCAVPPRSLLRIWRELEGARLARVGALRLAVWGGATPGPILAAARDRFGIAPTLAVIAKPGAAIAAARGDGVVAVLALDGAGWIRLLAEPAVRVFATLPESTSGRPLALAVAAAALGPTGDDRTLWATDAPGSAAVIEAQLGALGFAADLWSAAGGLKLFALAGYVQPHDERLAAAPGRLTGVIGSAPVFAA
ncbi:hypothetical protein BH09PSE2_BH09PSE2_01910 [soil metagenome]